MNARSRIDIERLIATCGFDDSGHCAASCLKVREEVRDMCAAGRCGQYAKNWACPPACGSLADFQKRLSEFADCYALQTVERLDDEFDFETMMHAEKVQKERVFALAESLTRTGVDALVLASGTCTICPECSYPDAPCRFPERRLVSMEAAGLLVNDVCEACGTLYNHGKGTITYTSCVLL